MGAQSIDTRTATGELMVTMFGAIAACERDIMLERQREGIKAARAEGKYVGRQPTAQKQADKMRALFANGMTNKPELAQECGISLASVYRILGATSPQAAL